MGGFKVFAGGLQLRLLAHLMKLNFIQYIWGYDSLFQNSVFFFFLDGLD